MIAFVGSIVFLLLQSVLAFFILDKKRGSPLSMIAAIILTGGGLVSTMCLMRMSRRFLFNTDIAMSQSIDDDDELDSRRRTNLLSLVSTEGKDPDELVEDVLGRSPGQCARRR